MRTKTLLLTAAAFAVGIVASQAQTPVYSQNIVGYVTQTLPIGWSAVSVPLDLSAGNSLTNLFPNAPVGGPTSGPLDGALAYIWNGTGYSIYTLDSDRPTGVGNASDTAGVTAPTINPGTLIYLHNFPNNVTITTTNVLTGTVHYDTAPNFTTTFVGQTTNKLIVGYNFVASKLPIGGAFTSVLQLTNPVAGSGYGPLDGSIVYIPNIVNGNFTGYSIYTIDSTKSTGWGNASDTVAVAEPQLPVGSAAIISYGDINAQGPYYWVQSY
jgi:hypothetical protein